MREQIHLFELTMKRHPDPATVYNQEVAYPELQMRGVWQKVAVKSDVKPPARQGFSCWVWGGKMYVMGGNGTSVQYEDMWLVVSPAYMDLIRTQSSPEGA